MYEEGLSTNIMSVFRDYCCCAFLCPCWKSAFEWGEGEAEDDDAVGLSHVGTAVYDVLRVKYWWFHHRLWNVTSGRFVALDHTPRQALATDDPRALRDGHSDWFPEKLASIVALTEVWCDVTSLGPPDGAFLTHFNDALKQLHEKNKPIVVRMLFGNVIGMPVNCNAVIAQLTKDIPADKTKLKLWVGAWRKGVSWNHSKIIAVDGNILHTGGHNLWDAHYLRFDPVHDLSIQLEGRVTHDGHLYCNEHWHFIEKMQRTVIGFIIDKTPDWMPVALKTRVTVSEFPRGKVGTYPPYYYKGLVPRVFPGRNVKYAPMITIGRYGKLTSFGIRPSDSAIVAMLGSAKTIIRMALQDIGPVCIPQSKVALPGCVWPKSYLNALGRVIWERGVDVELVVSNPQSIPGGLGMTEACYGNGWTCVDVAAEIIKTIREQYSDVDDTKLRKKVAENLRVCFMRGKHGSQYEDGMTVGLHSKHFIVDDVCTYVGSQNLYICDLAEWGVIIDDREATASIMEQFWNPLWAASYREEDCDVQAVMDGLMINRDGENPYYISAETQKLIDEADQSMMDVGHHAGTVVMSSNKDNYFASEGAIEVEESSGR